MKIYNKIVIDMKTGDVIEEDSYEYSGPVAKCLDFFGDMMGGISGLFGGNYDVGGFGGAPGPGEGGGGGLGSYGGYVGDMIGNAMGGGPMVSGGIGGGMFPANNQQTQPNIMDWLTNLFGDGADIGNLPGALYGIPEMPSLTAGLDQLSPYNVPQLPQFNYGALDPTLKASIERPYMDALMMAREQLGGAGILGTQGRETPLFSGAAGNVLGRMAQDAGPVMAQTAYNLTMPQAMQGWQADLGRNITGYNTALQGLTTDYSGEMQRRNEYMAQLGMPYNMLPGMMGGTYSTPIVQQGGSTSGAIGGGLMGAALPAMMGMNPLWGIATGLGGLLGGI